jgi:hypothetical protein
MRYSSTNPHTFKFLELSEIFLALCQKKSTTIQITIQICYTIITEKFEINVHHHEDNSRF